MIEQFERQELWALTSKARKNLEAVTNPEWKMVYENFIFACSALDAFIARSTGPSDTPKPYVGDVPPVIESLIQTC